MLSYIAIISITLLVSILATSLVRKVTQTHGWVAHPKADRWHESTTALHGGVGIFIAFIIGSGLLFLAIHFDLIKASSIEIDSLSLFFQKYSTILLGATIIFAIGLVDDIFHLKPAVKLLGQFVAVSIVIFFDVCYQTPFFPWIGILVSYLWFVGIINAVNLLDNMDGVSAGVVIIGTLGVALLGIFGYSAQLPPSVFIAGILITASLGFWLYNKPPAKIFMGDSGSLVIGFVFAAITIPSELNAFYIPEVDFSIWDKVTELLIATILAAIPILDTTLVTITRLMRGQSPSQGGRDHSTHRLVQSGLSNWQMLGILYSIAGFCALVALIIGIFPHIGFVVFSGVFLSMLIVAFYLASIRIQVAPIKKEGWQQLATSIAYRLPLIKMTMDIIIVAMSFQLAYFIRFDFRVNHDLTESMLQTLPLVILGCLLSNFLTRVYDFSWKKAQKGDLLTYIGTAILGSAISLGFVAIANSFGLYYSRGGFLLFAIIYFFALCGTRYSYQIIDESLLRLRLNQGEEGKIPLLLYGIPEGIDTVLFELSHNTTKWGNYKIIGLIDPTGEFNTPTGTYNRIPVKSSLEWEQTNYASQPEILLIDPEVEPNTVREFGNSITAGIRIRKLVHQTVEL